MTAPIALMCTWYGAKCGKGHGAEGGVVRCAWEQNRLGADCAHCANVHLVWSKCGKGYGVEGGVVRCAWEQNRL
eukprot:366324-Chlamydomonas_euryale.AAC.10